MNRNTFDQVIECIKKIDSFNDKLCDAGLDFFNTECCDAIYKMQRILFEQEYGKEGNELIDWFMYELPDYRKRHPEEKDVMWDENENPIPMENYDDLYNYLEKEYGTANDK